MNEVQDIKGEMARPTCVNCKVDVAPGDLLCKSCREELRAEAEYAVALQMELERKRAEAIEHNPFKCGLMDCVFCIEYWKAEAEDAAYLDSLEDSQ